MTDTQTAAAPCSVCGRADVPAPKASWLHPTLAVALLSGVVYFLYQLADMFSKVQSFEIYTTPPGISEILHLLVTVVVIVAAGCGLNPKALIANVVGSFMGATKADP